MVSAQEIPHEWPSAVDLSDLLADLDTLLNHLGDCDNPLTVTHRGQPIADLWRYEPSPIALVGLNAQGVWTSESLEDTEGDFDAIVEASELRASFPELLRTLDGVDRQILITENGKWLAVLASHRDQPTPVGLSPDEWRAVKQEIWQGIGPGIPEDGSP